MNDEQSAVGAPTALGKNRFLSVALVGVLATLIATVHGSLPIQLAIVGFGLSVIAAALVTIVEHQASRERRILESLRSLHPPLTLTKHPDLFGYYTSLSRGLVRFAEQTDPLLHEFARMKLANLTEQVTSLAGGEIVFTSTESWRTAYERLLQYHGLGEYLSVAWVKSAGYWHDTPGRQSLRLNYDMAARGLRIERFIILRDSLWPPGERSPSPDVLAWIDEQHQHGLLLKLARESTLLGEPDLLCDFGIYGGRAIGIHDIDDHSRTLRFVLHFDRQRFQQAHERWSRLSLYGEWYSVLLDGTRRDG